MNESILKKTEGLQIDMWAERSLCDGNSQQLGLDAVAPINNQPSRMEGLPAEL